MNRHRQQIEIGERIARERGLDRDACVDAAHFMIDDGGAARQGDDPEQVSRVGLTDLYPRAVEIERKAARGWSPHEWANVEFRLRAYGPTRVKDIERLAAHRCVA